ncbi:hypothetical protein TanjilG_28035 [Lupinus angustifolius]|uniref:Uncharacterized protein n=1 Tax=Lupinus angustifolius TaxID=3871 RepID=A0A4P1RGK7_LUPAN|nr:hypothetical protein TanjilG_28035 [Lupinus angustifolius]
MEEIAEQMQNLRSKATELFIREEWEDSIDAYSHFITLSTQHQTPSDPDQLQKLHKSLCIAFCNRDEARFKIGYLYCALQDCDHALKIDGTHFKTLLCKGKILINLNRYPLECFRSTLIDPQAVENSEMVNGYVEKCKKFEYLSRTGSIDLSYWGGSGFQGKAPELAEHVGPVQIRKSEISGRGMFATKNIDAGSLILVTKAIPMRGVYGEFLMEDLKKIGGGVVEMEKALKLARDVYGKVVKKKAMRTLLELYIGA